jgi:hypothetical protein
VEMLYCYRCRREVPMLTEAEMAFFQDLWAECVVLRWDEQEQPHVEGVERFLAEYEQRTGFRGDHAKDFLHHLRASFGPLCGECGKPLRTPRASKCMECGGPRPA